jgi:thiol-disulfide isomerase/thioredoxin
MPKKSFFNTFVIITVLGMIVSVTMLFSKYPALNAPVADFSFQDANDQTGHLYQFTHQKVMLHFWASWCLPCRTELPRLFHAASRMPKTAFVMVSTDKNKQDMLNFLLPYKAHIPNNVIIISDPNKTISLDHFKVDQYPETIILNANKTIAYHFYGAIDWENIHE